jgi:hypothetical protein
MSDSVKRKVTNFDGLKLLLIQDEYENTETARKNIVSLGIHVVYTCVPEKYIETIYPKDRFPSTKFLNTLTGYVPHLCEKGFDPKPIDQRRYVIGYRGRLLPYWYGELGREKYYIGIKMKAICRKKNIPCDIEWSEENRLYGDAWYEFLQDCRATIGTESGSNIFDFNGSIKSFVENEIKRNPTISYEKIHSLYLAEHEGNICMNQISPRVFEAIGFKTCLVLFEGQYSNIIEPDKHYIPLKKDFSNITDQ